MTSKIIIVPAWHTVSHLTASGRTVDILHHALIVSTYAHSLVQKACSQLAILSISCRVYKQIREFTSWVQSNSPGSNIMTLTNIYQVAKMCDHLADAIAPPQVYGKDSQYRVTLTCYGPPANPVTLQVSICYMPCSQSTSLPQQ